MLIEAEYFFASQSSIKWATRRKIHLLYWRGDIVWFGRACVSSALKMFLAVSPRISLKSHDGPEVSKQALDGGISEFCSSHATIRT